MKISFSFFLVLINLYSCTSLSSYKDSAENTKSMIGQNNTAILYSAISRGSYQFIKITKDSISISEDRNLKKIELYPCSIENWKLISSLLNEIDPEELTKLEPPTDKRLYDGAPIAVLTIEQMGKDYSTPGFDHGFPPKKIQEIVNRILTIKNTLKKE